MLGMLQGDLMHYPSRGLLLLAQLLDEPLDLRTGPFSIFSFGLFVELHFAGTTSGLTDADGSCILRTLNLTKTEQIKDKIYQSRGNECLISH